ncbi:MAG: AAA family ATPase [Salinarimonas sp.]
MTALSTPPAGALPDLDAINHLRGFRQWVAWKSVQDAPGKKARKVPVDPHTGRNGSSTSPATWGTLDDAEACAARLGLPGVGFALSDDDNLTGIDLDNVRDPETGALEPWAQEIIDLGETYAEVSPSGRGLRLLAIGKVDAALKADRAGVEIYGRSRFVTITGAHLWQTPSAILAAPETLALLRARAEAAKPTPPPAATVARTTGASPFRAINDRALSNLAAWVPELFGSAARPAPGTGGYRVTSAALGRDLEEDLSITPLGIVDYGVHDLGDTRAGKRTAVDLVVEHGGAPNEREAFLWLCRRLGVDPAAIGWKDVAGGSERDELGTQIASAILAGRKGEEPAPLISATPFVWCEPTTIPQRDWLYGGHYIRKFLGVTVAPGGVGKSSLTIVEALAMASGRDLLGVQPQGRFRVWLWNGEDPIEELQRRVIAAMKYYSLSREDVEGWLFLDSGRTSEIIIAEQTPKGVTIAIPTLKSISSTIQYNSIDVMIIDPFVSSHRIGENDNMAVNVVATKWAEIADECECSIELVHHSRKTMGGEVTIEDARGGSSLLAKARSGRALNAMTKDEGAKAGVDRPRLHFRVDDGKTSMTPPPEGSTWFKLESVPLGNGPLGTDGDKVGVVTAWKWPNQTADVTVADLRKVQANVAAGEWRADVQAKAWVGNAVAQALGLDVESRSARAKIVAMLKMWTASGALVVVEAHDEKRRMRKFVEVGEVADD